MVRVDICPRVGFAVFGVIFFHFFVNWNGYYYWKDYHGCWNDCLDTMMGRMMMSSLNAVVDLDNDY